MLQITSATLWNKSPVKQLKCKLNDPLYLTSWVTNNAIFDTSCYSTCMLTYMTCYFRWTKLHVDQQAMLFFNISCYSTCMLFLTCHAIFRWTHPKAQFIRMTRMTCHSKLLIVQHCCLVPLVNKHSFLLFT